MRTLLCACSLLFSVTVAAHNFTPVFEDSFGNVWGERLDRKMEQEQASEACRAMGVRLPTANQYRQLMQTLGEGGETAHKYLFLGPQARREFAQIFTVTTGFSAYWTRTQATREGFFDVFLDGTEGDGFLDYSLYKTRLYHVLCVQF